VGHTERFNPALRTVGRLAPQVVEARRTTPRTGRSQDIDVVLDLMIHDLDLVLCWCKGEVEWFDAAGVAVDAARIDTASVRLRTSDGLVANLFASRVAESAVRTIRAYEEGRSATLDLLAGRAWIGDRELERTDGRDALSAQWEAFVEAVLGRAAPVVDGPQGARVVELAERISSAITPT
jgi:predicted dehydrogenase